MTQYTVEYFKAKFEAIPEEKWCVGGFVDPKDSEKRCAMGHCGCAAKNPEIDALCDLFNSCREAGHRMMWIGEINDGGDPRFPQPTPKQRILAALDFIAEKTFGSEKNQDAISGAQRRVAIDL